MAPRGRRVLGGGLRDLRCPDGRVAAPRSHATRRRPRAHVGATDPRGRRPLRTGCVVGRPSHAADPEPFPRARTGPELVVPPARHALSGVAASSIEQQQTEALLDPSRDPGGAAMGPLGDGSVEANWFVLLQRRGTARAVRSERYPWWALTALLAGLLALNVTFTVFVVALPTVKAEFDTNFSVLAWASTGPLLAFGVAAPFFGKVGDLFGHRRLYQYGLLGAMVSAVLPAPAPDVGMLLFARTLDGVVGAATGTASMAIILELFAPEERVKALGWWSLGGAGGPVLGVTLGSPVIQYFGWRTLFWGQLVLLVAASAVVALLLPTRRRGRTDPDESDRKKSKVWEGMDWVGSWSLAGGVTAAMLVLSIGPIAGWTSVGVIVSGVGPVVLGGG